MVGCGIKEGGLRGGGYLPFPSLTVLAVKSAGNCEGGGASRHSPVVGLIHALPAATDLFLSKTRRVAEELTNSCRLLGVVVVVV